ncbi:SH2 domain-containing protein 1A-like [Chanos chanos]|uniref:SH2 domain-containing protein 1A-like n=1 Tax=Chanos chanos TaxID=29144 RepID=A0A6J2WVE7_CHACN|nr:SH2 domain-containing protein 1A-like [Chanos chanos]
MEELAVYHGAISKAVAEKLLGACGRDGSYLIRDSESVQGTYCLCVLSDTYVYTYRLYQVEGGFWTAETAPGARERLFRKLRNLIASFTRPNQGIVTPLLYPVIRLPRDRINNVN